MPLRRTAAATALLAVVLLAAPALAAPIRETGPNLQLRQILTHWWVQAAAPVHSLFAPNAHTVDPNGEPAPAPQNGLAIDPSRQSATAGYRPTDHNG